MVGVFFLTSFPILDVEHFSQMILWIVLQIMPPPNYPNHQVLFTASDGWVFFLRAFLTSSPILDLEHFSQVILRIVLQIMPPPKITPTIRCCSQHLMVGTSSPILDLEHFSQVILRIVLQIMPPPNYPNHQVLDLEHFSQVIYELYYRLCPPPKLTRTIRCCSQHLMVGCFFFWPLFLFWT